MQVFTDTPEVLKSRAAVMEFILVNHPIDCPICDKAGECMLQDYYMAHDRQRSELREEKTHKPRKVPFGDRILYNGERCITCQRCTRFTAHVSKTHELGIVNRGDRSLVEVVEGGTFDNAYTDCVSDICPVGALTKTDFRFKKRVWFLKHTESVCGGCDRNCNTVLDHDGGEVVRVMPRLRKGVNDWWMCNEGRDLYKEIEAATRVHAVANSVGESTWDAALEWLAGALKGKVAFVASPWMSNEEGYALAHLARQLDGARMGIKRDRTDGYRADDLLHTASHNPNRKGLLDAGVGDDLDAILADLGSLDTLVVFGPGLANYFDDDAACTAALSGAGLVVHVTDVADAVTELAGIVLPVSNHTEKRGTWTNADGAHSRFRRAFSPPRDARDTSAVLIDLARAAGLEPAGKSFLALRRALGQQVEEPREVADGQLRFPKTQTMFRHASGVAKV